MPKRISISEGTKNGSSLVLPNSKFSFNLKVKLALVSKKETPFFCCENEIKTLKKQ